MATLLTNEFSRAPVHRIGWYFGCLLIGIATLGCVQRSVRPAFSTPALEPFSTSGEAELPDRWWTAFEDPGLNACVNQALGENLQLSVALQRLRAARAVTRREASDLFPDIDGIIGTDWTFGPGPDQTRIAWGLDASYQVDLWGQIQSRVDAERWRAEATHADYHAVALTLVAEVARTWFSLVEARAQLELLDVQLETNRRGLAAQEARVVAGAGKGISDVLRQRQLVESTLEQTVIVRARIDVLEHQLAVLLGELPQSASYDTGTELPKLPPVPNAGLPSELLRRRPDVRRDYRAFLAADRDLASAISARYPRLNITGALVNSADRSDTLFRDWFVSIGGQLIAPLVDGGQRRAEVNRTEAVVCQRYQEYGQTMLVAFQEVEDSLALERHQTQRITHLREQVKWAEQASDQLRDQLFLDADTTFLDVLSSIQSQQRLQRETLSARLDLVLIRIGLYLALAGDFETGPQIAGEDGADDLDFPAAATAGPPMLAVEPPALPSSPVERVPPVELDFATELDE